MPAPAIRIVERAGPGKGGTGADMLSQPAAEKMAADLQAWWHNRGYSGARFAAEAVDARGTNGGRMRVWVVRSNLINGLPPGQARRVLPVKVLLSAPKGSAARVRKRALQRPGQLRPLHRRILIDFALLLAINKRPTAGIIAERLDLDRVQVANVLHLLREKKYIRNDGGRGLQAKWQVLRDAEGRPLRGGKP